jgi:ketosteroid isomerase-like protein
MPNENVEMVRWIYDAFNRGDIEAAFEHVSPDFEGIPDERDLAGPVRGRENVRRVVEEWNDFFAESRVRPERFFEAGDQVIAFVRNTGRGRGSGVELDVRVAQVWTFRAGTPVRVQTYADREKALEAVGLAG